ncbi:MAG: hypothetical protein HOP01_03410 [Gallionella sp.]|nr:hypothetical protein [Gallionella sp.]
MTFEMLLQPTDDLANPTFKNAASCALWLRQLQLTNLQPAHQQLLAQVSELNRYPMHDIERLNTLEELRETVDHVQKSYATKLISRPLPFNRTELVVFMSILQLWKAMSQGYQRCLKSYMDGNQELDQHIALLCQRCMLYSGLTILEHLRAGYEFDDKHWAQLHQFYQFAEASKRQLEEVVDPLMGSHPNSSCHRIYVKILLACSAHPAELNRMQLQMLDNWLSEWSKEIVVEEDVAHAKAQRLVTDISGRKGLYPAQQITHSKNMRYLSITPISKLLKVHIILLEQGKSPQQLNMGEGSSKEAIKFLTFLHQCWCENRNLRAITRLPTSRNAMLCFQAEDIYAHVCGEAFKQPTKNSVSNALTLKQSQVLERTMSRVSSQHSPPEYIQSETWHVENENILGAQLTRTTQGASIGFNQFLAIRLAGDTHFSLAATAWVNVPITGQLRMGIRYLPGEVQAVSVRVADRLEEYAPAFILGASVNLKVPSSLILPRNWFQANRMLEIVMRNGEQRKIKLGFSVERGVDYERVSFNFV